MRAATLFAATFLLGASVALAAEPAPTGLWRATNDCFLRAFMLQESGTALLAYASGEEDEHGGWNWDGAKLTITSMMFPKDSFSGQLAEDHVQAEYTWHDKEKDELHPETCSFERFAPIGL